MIVEFCLYGNMANSYLNIVVASYDLRAMVIVYPSEKGMYNYL